MTTLITALLVSALAVLLGTVALGLVAALLGPERRSSALATGGTTDAPGSPMPALLPAGVALGAGLLVSAVVTRAILVGHAPWSNLHEFSIAFAAALLVTYLALARTFPIAGLAPVVALIGAGLVGVALGLEDRVDPLVPALQQPLLLTIHVGSAVVAYAVAGIAFAAAAAEIGQRVASNRLSLLPTRDVARAVSHRAVLIGFPILTIAIALGSIWANLAWRSYWSNDPKELAAAATWLVFGAYLHVAGRRDRWERLAPWLIVLGFVGVLFTYIGAGLFIVGEHSYGTP
jgi:cytochrome c-type biogenesis protein CcsB